MLPNVATWRARHHPVTGNNLNKWLRLGNSLLVLASTNWKSREFPRRSTTPKADSQTYLCTPIDDLVGKGKPAADLLRRPYKN